MRWAVIGAAAVVAGAEQVHARDRGSARIETEQLHIALDDGLLSVRTEAVPLGVVLRAIEDATDVAITVEGTLGNVRAQAFRGLPIEDSLRRLVGDGHGLLMVYRSHPGGIDGRELDEAYVYGDGLGGGPGGTADSVVRGQTEPERTQPVEADGPAARYLYGRDDAERREAAKQLKDGADDAVPVLTAALGDPDGEVRLRALRALPTLEGSDALNRLTSVVRGDPEARLRQAAVYMLGGFAAPEVQRVLRAALTDPDEGVRRAAAQTLSQLRAD